MSMWCFFPIFTHPPPPYPSVIYYKHNSMYPIEDYVMVDEFFTVYG